MHRGMHDFLFYFRRNTLNVKTDMKLHHWDLILNFSLPASRRKKWENILCNFCWTLSSDTLPAATRVTENLQISESRPELKKGFFCLFYILNKVCSKQTFTYWFAFPCQSNRLINVLCFCTSGTTFVQCELTLNACFSSIFQNNQTDKNTYS